MEGAPEVVEGDGTRKGCPPQIVAEEEHRTTDEVTRHKGDVVGESFWIDLHGK